MKTIQSIGIWGNTEKSQFWALLHPLLDWIQAKNLTPFITTRIREMTREPFSDSIRIIEKPADLDRLDLLLVLGGDGTLLSASRAVMNYDLPILGIHLGNLGFLAKVMEKDLTVRLEDILAENYSLDSRSMLEGLFKKNGETISHFALNDIVIRNSESHRMMSIKVKVNGAFVGDYKADGLIVATPTGSTAYSLSAGGPIMAPDVHTIVITPISPHSLTSRSLVVSDKSMIDIQIVDQEEPFIFTADGQIHETLFPSEMIQVKIAKHRVQLIDFGDQSYFKTLRTKMGWGKRGE